MLSHPELGSDPPIGSDRESGRDTDFLLLAFSHKTSWLHHVDAFLKIVLIEP